MDHLPGLGVYIVAVQLIWQSVVRRTSENIEVAVEGNHRVAVAPLGRRRGAPQQVFGRDARPPENMS